MATSGAPAASATPRFERVPAARGSVLRAWVAVGRPHRTYARWYRAIAAWAGAATPGWIVASLAAAFGIDLASSAIGAVYGVQRGRLVLHAPTRSDLAAQAHGPFWHLVAVFVIAAAVAAMTSLLRYGRFGERFARILRPWALVQPAIACAGVVAALVTPLVSLAESANAVIFTLASVAALVLPGYCIGVALSAIEVGAYRFARQRVLQVVVFVTWLAAAVAFSAAGQGISHALATR